MTFPFTFTCTFITRTDSGTKDPLGNKIYTETSVAAVTGCVFAPGGSTEILGNEDTVDDRPTLYAPTGTAVTGIDAITVPGYGTFEVDGAPSVWPANPMGGWQPPNSVVIKLRKVDG